MSTRVKTMRGGVIRVLCLAALVAPGCGVKKSSDAESSSGADTEEGTDAGMTETSTAADDDEGAEGAVATTADDRGDGTSGGITGSTTSDGSSSAAGDDTSMGSSTSGGSSSSGSTGGSSGSSTSGGSSSSSSTTDTGGSSSSTGGSSSSSGGSSSSSTGGDPGEGQDWGPCRPGNLCDDAESVCAAGICEPVCDEFSPPQDCGPAPAGVTARPACADVGPFGGWRCILECGLFDTCPAQMECNDTVGGYCVSI